MLSEHIEVLQSPWLIELGAFYINFSKSNGRRFDEPLNPFSCDLCTTEPKMTLMLPDMVKLEYNLTCPICLVRFFSPLFHFMPSLQFSNRISNVILSRNLFSNHMPWVADISFANHVLALQLL